MRFIYQKINANLLIWFLLAVFSASIFLVVINFYFPFGEHKPAQAVTNCTWQASENSTWNTAGNWSCGSVPDTSTELAIFDDTSDFNCNFDTTGITITALQLNSGYDGTLDLNSNSLTVNGNIDVADANATLDLDGSTLTVIGLINYTAGTITPGTSSVVHADDYGTTWIGTYSLNNFEIDCWRGTGGKFKVNDGDTLTVNGTLTLTNGQVDNGGNLVTAGSIVQESGFDGGGETLTLDSGGAQDLTINGGVGPIYVFNHADLNITPSASWTANQLTLTSGTFNESTVTTTINGTAFTINGGTYNTGSGDGGLATTAEYGTTFTGNVTVNNFEINNSRGSGGRTKINSGDTMTVNGTFTMTNGQLDAGGTLDAKGTVVQESGFDGGGGVVTINGSGAQTFTINGGTGPDYTFDNSNLDVTPSADWGLNDLTLTSGTLNGGTGITTTISGNLTLDGGTFTAETGEVVLTREGGATVTGTVTFNDLTLNLNRNYQNIAFTGGTATVNGTLTLTKGTMSGTLNAKGDITLGSTYGSYTVGTGGSGEIVVNGSSTQTLTGNATASTGAIPDIDIQNDLNLTGTIRTLDNWTYTSGTVDAGSSTVVFGNADMTIDSNGMSFNDVTLNAATATSDTSLGSNIDIDGTLTISSNGELETTATDYSVTVGVFTMTGGNFDANDSTITCEGNWSAAGGTFTGTGSTIQFTTSGNDFFDPGSSTYKNITVNKAAISDSVTLLNNSLTMAASSTLTITTGIFYIGGENLDVGSGSTSTIGASGIFWVQGGETISNFTNSTAASSGTIVYKGTTAYGSGLIAGDSYYNLIFNSTDGNGSWDLDAALTVNNDLTITSGILDLAGQDATVTSTFTNNDTFRLQGDETTVTLTMDTDTGTVIYDGSTFAESLKLGNTYNNLEFNVMSGFWNVASSKLMVNGTLTLTQGTLDINGQDLEVTGTFTNNAILRLLGSETTTFTSGFDTDSGDVMFDGESTYTGGLPPGNTYNDLTFSGANGTWDVTSSDLTVNGNLTITDGTLNLNGQGLTVTGTFSNDDDTDSDGTLKLQGGESTWSVTMDTNSGTVVYTGTSSYTGLKAGNTYNNLEFNGSGGVWDVDTSTLTANGTLTLTNGTLDLNGQSLTATGTFANNATLRLQGGETTTFTAGFDSNSGTVIYDGTSTYTELKAGDSYYDLTFNGSGTWDLDAALAVGNDLTITDGTLDLAGQNLTVTGALDNNDILKLQGGETTLTYASFDATGGTVTYDGTSTYTELKAGDAYFNLTFAGSGSWTLDADLDVSNNLTIGANDTLNVSGDNRDITIDQNFANSGTFTPQSGAVIFEASSKTSVISGSTTFYDFTCITAGKTINFTAGTTQTISGTFTITGTDTSSNDVTLYSTSAGTQWLLDVDGSSSVNYVDVKDCDNSATASAIIPANYTDSGNNTGWFDNSPSAPTSLRAEGSTNPVNVTDTTPEFSAIYNDPDSGDIANRYCIEVDTASGFNGTNMWYSDSDSCDTGTSITDITEGNRSTDITYAGTTLTLNGTVYYWRIKFWDDYGGTSSSIREGSFSSAASFTMQTPPEAPTGLSATRASDEQFNLAFTDASTYEDNFEIERKTDTGSGWGSFTQVSTPAADATSWIDNSTNNPTDYPQIDERYQYQIRACNTSGCSSYNTDSNTYYNRPGIPTDLESSYEASTNIYTLTWSDNSDFADTYKVYVSIDNGDNWSDAINVNAGVETYDYTTAEEDETYSFQLKAYITTAELLSDAIDTTSSPRPSRPPAPTIGTPEAVSSVSIAWNWTDNASTETSYRVDYVDAGENGSTGDDVDGLDVNSTSWTDTDLSVNTAYQVHAHSFGVGGESVASSNATKTYTLANAPGTPTLTASSSTSLNIVLGVNSNPSYTAFAIQETTTGQYVQSDDGALDTSADWQNYATWGAATGTTITGLSVNTQYIFQVKARNEDSTETGFSTTASKYTLANVPGAPSLPTALVTSSALKVVLDVNSNPATTEFAIYETGQGAYLQTGLTFAVSAAWQNYADWGSSSGKTISNLTADTTYTFQVKARNAEETETDFGSTAAATTSSAGVPNPIRQDWDDQIEADDPTYAPTPAPESRDPVPSATSIKWYFKEYSINEQGFKIKDSSGSVLKTTYTPNLSYVTEDDLVPNTFYQGRRVVAYNDVGESEVTLLPSVWTLPAEPTNIRIVPVSSYSIQSDDWTASTLTTSTAPGRMTGAVKLYFSANGNPDYTKYLVREDTTGRFLDEDGNIQLESQWLTYEEWSQPQGLLIPDLSEGSSYTFSVKARNEIGQEAVTSSPLRIPALDTTPPDTPTITQPFEGLILNTNLITFTGEAEENSSVLLYLSKELAPSSDGVQHTCPTDETGSFFCTLTQEEGSVLSSGSYTLKARTQDPSFNLSEYSSSISFSLDLPPELEPEEEAEEEEEEEPTPEDIVEEIEESLKEREISVSLDNSSFTLEPTFLRVGDTTTLTVELRDDVNNPLAAHTLNLTSSSLDDLILGDGVTNEQGITTFTITSDKAHTSVLSLYDQTEDYQLATLTLIFEAHVPGILLIEADNYDLKPKGLLTFKDASKLTFRLYDEYYNPLIEEEYTLELALDPALGILDEEILIIKNGEASTTYHSVTEEEIPDPQTLVEVLAYLPELDIYSSIIFTLTRPMTLEEERASYKQRLRQELEPEEGVYIALKANLPQVPNEDKQMMIIADEPFVLSFIPTGPVSKVSVFIFNEEREMFDLDRDGTYTIDYTISKAYKNQEVPMLILEERPSGKVQVSPASILVDPYGYVYEVLTKSQVENYIQKSPSLANVLDKLEGQEIKIPDATTILYWQDPIDDTWVKWPSEDFDQQNPLRTNQKGEYAFMVPPGRYYLKVVKDGYELYVSRRFEVEASNPLNLNIKLSPAVFFSFQKIQTILNMIGIRTNLPDDVLIPLLLLILNLVLGLPLIAWGYVRYRRGHKKVNLDKLKGKNKK